MDNLNFENLKQLLNHGILNGADYENIKKVDEVYPFNISQHLLKRILESKSEGLINQFIPKIEEIEVKGGCPAAFFPDELHPTEITAKKYPNRVIMYLTHTCNAYCRHCSRKSLWKKTPGYSRLLVDKSLSWLRQDSSIEEVIITGGDPFTLSDENLKYVLVELNSISHIKVIRIGTRAFSSFPERITDNLCNILGDIKSLVICTQINHPDEFCTESIIAIKKIQSRGIPLLNQMVLLKNVNDSFSVLKSLLTKCAENRIVPYYLFHCFNIEGAKHLRTPVDTGVLLIKQLTGIIGGWWIPKYCLISHKNGVKIPLSPNPVVSRDEEKIILEDYRGRIYEYE